jgi:hypothetical protein
LHPSRRGRDVPRDLPVLRHVLIQYLQTDPHPHATHRNPDVRVDEPRVIRFLSALVLDAEAGMEESSS